MKPLVVKPLVVKLGGAQAASPDLPRWLAAVEAARLPLVLVSGGGPFADAVREAQTRIGFSDAAAHRMALLAMEAFGLALADLAPRLAPASSEAEIAAALARNRVPLWSPRALLAGAPDVPESWVVTSDSLALRLAARLAAPALLLVKAVDLPAKADLGELVRANVLDAAFPRFAARFHGDIRLAGPALLDGTARAWAEGRPGGVILRAAVPAPIG